ncbi:MAG: TRAP transporter small permease [Alphaproteobacteria bacterium]
MDGWERMAAWLARAFHAAGTLVVMPGLVVLVTVDVVLRYVFSAPLAWGNEVGALLLLLVFLASLPWCTHSGQHIRMELLYLRFGPAWRRAADVLSGLAGIAVSAMLAWRAAQAADEMFRYGEGAEFVRLPFWPFAVFMALVGAVLVLEFARRAALALRGRDGAAARRG